MQEEHWLRRRLEWSDVPLFNRQLQKWLAETPQYQKAELLLRILRRRSDDRILYPFALFIFILNLVSGVGIFRKPAFLIITLIAGVYALALFLRRRVCYEKAALLLAGMNDDRVIPHLTDLWNFRMRQGLRSSEQATVTGELTRLLTHTLPTGTQGYIAESLRGFARKHLLGRPFQQEEVTEEQADLFVAVLRYLAANGSQDDEGLLLKIANQEVTSEMARLVVEAARCMALPAPEPPVILPQAQTTAQTPTTETVVLRSRRG